MAASAVTYPDWKAPREDGEVLVWPEPGDLAADTGANQKLLSTATAAIQNVPLRELRRETRRWLGHDDAQPLIVDGHQTELYHPGVWVKSVLANELAAKISGHALHLAVDTDAPKHLNLRWPGGGTPITDDPQIARAHWSGLLDAPSPRHLGEIERAIGAVTFEQPPVVGGFLASLRRLSLEQVNLSTAMTNAMHELDWQLGLRHHAFLASPVWESRGFLVFLHHLIARAGEFAAAYNGALAHYRREQKIKTVMRPMPDLAAFEDSVELPFWLDELKTGGRTRPSVFADGGGYLLTLNSGEEFTFDPSTDGFEAADRLAAWLRKNQLRFSPRALVLTMFVRLCVADQFVHGIGGGRYCDQVTDQIIAKYFGIMPPRFCVTTATMYMPEAAGRVQICVQCVEREGHSLRHGVLGDAKKPYLDRIAACPRRHSRERYEAFTQMHRGLAGHAAHRRASGDSRLGKTGGRGRDSATRRRPSSSIANCFTRCSSTGRLEQMIGRYRRFIQRLTDAFRSRSVGKSRPSIRS